MKEWMELVDYKITEGGDYGWQCYGPNAYTLDSWNGVHGKGGYSFSIVFSTKSQKVYEVSMCDYTNDRAYRMINPKNVEKHRKEAESKSVLANQAWDDVDYIDLEVKEDFMEKAKAILLGEAYDSRVQIPLDLTHSELFDLMKMAHSLDLTFNQLVEEILIKASKLKSEDFSIKKTVDNEDDELPTLIMDEE
jgi:hypothetical protein